MRLKWILVLVCLEIMLIWTQDRCTVCVKRSIGSKIVLDARVDLLSDTSHVESHFNPFGDTVSVSARQVHGLKIVLILIQNNCKVCAERTRGSKIFLDEPDGTSR
jgi:hypothetical protein